MLFSPFFLIQSQTNAPLYSDYQTLILFELLISAFGHDFLFCLIVRPPRIAMTCAPKIRSNHAFAGEKTWSGSKNT